MDEASPTIAYLTALYLVLSSVVSIMAMGLRIITQKVMKANLCVLAGMIFLVAFDRFYLLVNFPLMCCLAAGSFIGVFFFVRERRVYRIIGANDPKRANTSESMG